MINEVLNIRISSHAQLDRLCTNQSNHSNRRARRLDGEHTAHTARAWITTSLRRFPTLPPKVLISEYRLRVPALDPEQ